MSQIKIDPQIAETWEKLSKGKTETNWMAVEFRKENKSCSLDLFAQGEGGLQEVTQKLKGFSDKAVFGLIKVKFYDEIATKKGSPYIKFIYFRFLGSKVGVMTKGFLTPRLGSIDEIFPVKHLSYDIDENLTKFDQKSIANDFLRVSDNKVEASSFDFGPQQIYYAQTEKVVNNNKQPQIQQHGGSKNKQQNVVKTDKPKKPDSKPQSQPEPEPEIVQPVDNDVKDDAPPQDDQPPQNNYDNNDDNNDNDNNNNANDNNDNNNNNNYDNNDNNDNNDNGYGNNDDNNVNEDNNDNNDDQDNQDNQDNQDD